MSLPLNRMYSYTLSIGGTCGPSFLRPSVPYDLTATFTEDTAFKRFDFLNPKLQKTT